MAALNRSLPVNKQRSMASLRTSGSQISRSSRLDKPHIYDIELLHNMRNKHQQGDIHQKKPHNTDSVANLLTQQDSGPERYQSTYGRQFGGGGDTSVKGQRYLGSRHMIKGDPFVYGSEKPMTMDKPLVEIPQPAAEEETKTKGSAADYEDGAPKPVLRNEDAWIPVYKNGEQWGFYDIMDGTLMGTNRQPTILRCCGRTLQDEHVQRKVVYFTDRYGKLSSNDNTGHLYIFDWDNQRHGPPMSDTREGCGRTWGEFENFIRLPEKLSWMTSKVEPKAHRSRKEIDEKPGTNPASMLMKELIRRPEWSDSAAEKAKPQKYAVIFITDPRSGQHNGRMIQGKASKIPVLLQPRGVIGCQFDTMTRTLYDLRTGQYLNVEAHPCGSGAYNIYDNGTERNKSPVARLLITIDASTPHGMLICNS